MSHLSRSPTDGYPTETSNLQAATESTLIDHIPDTNDISSAATLQKNAHIQFLIRNLVQGFPSKYTSQDASQPWLMFWTVQGFSVLGVALDPTNKQKIIDTVMAWQLPDGGFGGGPGQAAHLLPTYASVCTLAIVGRPGPGGGWDQIDREKMYKYFMSLKQPDGSFLVTHHAEVDVRGIYCLIAVAYFLDLLTPELVEGTPSFIASCQTYEGGFSSASQPYYSLSLNPPTPAPTPTQPSVLDSPRPPLGEAHGGYTFCSLASWVMLQPYLNLSTLSQSSFQRHLTPTSEPKPEINYKTLLRWLSNMQGSEVEIGGFKGRTNKLVDGCYSWWVGGSFGLLEAVGVGGHGEPQGLHDDGPASAQDTENWDDVDDSLFNRKALQEYILYAGQHPAGGLRDKPPKTPDAYHTLYCLAGLSAAQHRVLPSPTRRNVLLDAWESTSDPLDSLRKSVFADALSWSEEEGTSRFVGGDGNRLNGTHPLFNLTMTHTEAIMGHFYKQTVPPRKKTKAKST